MTDHSTVFRGGRVVSADGSFDADVLVVGEKIAAVGQLEEPATPQSSMPAAASCCRG